MTPSIMTHHPRPAAKPAITHARIGGTVTFCTIIEREGACKVHVWIRQPGATGLLVACSVPTGTGPRRFEIAQALRRELQPGTPCEAYGQRVAIAPEPKPDSTAAALPPNERPQLLLRGCSYVKPLSTVAPRGALRAPVRGSVFDDNRPLPTLAPEFLPTIPYPQERSRAAA